MVPYAYPQITVTEGPIYGMEYPMLVFIGRPTARLELYQVIAHEVGHEWFPMMVGQDEAAFAWMDEGFTTYIERTSVADLFPDFDPWEEPRTTYLGIAGNKGEAPLMRHIDLVFGEPCGVSAYYKPGTLLRSLQRILGDCVFFAGDADVRERVDVQAPVSVGLLQHHGAGVGARPGLVLLPVLVPHGTMDQSHRRRDADAGGVQVTVRDLGQVPAPTGDRGHHDRRPAGDADHPHRAVAEPVHPLGDGDHPGDRPRGARGAGPGGVLPRREPAEQRLDALSGSA